MKLIFKYTILYLVIIMTSCSCPTPTGNSLSDKNKMHECAIEEFDLDPVADRDSFKKVESDYTEVKTCENYEVDKLTHSVPYLIPKAAELLDKIGQGFKDKTKECGIENARIVVTSLLRTEADNDRLRKSNINVSPNSVHPYGATFDLSYVNFGSKINGKEQNNCKGILKDVLLELRSKGYCFAKEEKKQNCFHITARKTNDSEPIKSNIELPFEDSCLIGIDVSHYQGEIDWSKVKTFGEVPITYVYIKATEGSDWEDSTFDDHYVSAQKTNLKVGAYHFFRSTSSVKDQFNWFIKHYPKKSGNLTALVDVEKNLNWDHETFIKNLKDFLIRCEEYYGLKPVIYSTQRFYNTNLKGELDGYHLMIGRHSKYEPELLDGRDWTIWQYTQKAKIDGIQYYVDVDILDISMIPLEKLIIP